MKDGGAGRAAVVVALGTSLLIAGVAPAAALASPVEGSLPSGPAPAPERRLALSVPNLALPPLAALTQAQVGAGMAPAPRAAEVEPPITERWWFWAAVGGVVATTAIVLIVASSGQDQPKTDLGNMEAFGQQ